MKFDLPCFSVAEVTRIAKEYYGITGSAEPLPSERDQNFHLRADSGEEYVLKIANVIEDRAVLDLQNAAMTHLGSAGLSIPQVRRTENGESIATIQAASGDSHFLRMLNYVPGKLFASTRPHSPGLLRSLGEVLAKIDRSLSQFSHPAAHRDLKWDLARASWIRNYLDNIRGPSQRKLVESFLQEYECFVLPKAGNLRQSVIYNDANDHNILVRDGVVIGVIDFGDMIHSWTIGDLAVGIAYAVMNKPDPLTAAVHIVACYHNVLPLTESELEVLFPLICIRLCTTVTNAAYQRYADPENTYLTISEQPAWSALERLKSVPLQLAYYRFRHACGLTATPSSIAVLDWLKNQQDTFGPLLEADLDRAVPIDLSVGSSGSLAELCDTGMLTRRVFNEIPDGSVGIGGYNVARVLSDDDAFEIEGNDGPESRTIHLALDLFAQPGTVILAPLDGTVHSFRNNSAAKDYGPTVVLQHVVSDHLRFYTLYGHLSVDSLDGLREGKPIPKGKPVGKIGSSEINGGWPPHLHFQIITDMLGIRGDFPGNALPGQRDFWLELCPDPNWIAQLPVVQTKHLTAEQILRSRAQHIGKSLSIAYRQPLQIVRGWMQHLYDENGRAYLDCVNNVAHVGHCHPRVVAAGQKQMSVLNTNTRYLHEDLVRYSERICATLPDPLRVCFFVCSGSEANELALRLARTRTGRKNFLVMEAGYHGNTSGLIEISAYKFDGPAGKGAPPHVRKVPIPDIYRGPFKNDDPDAAHKYALHIKESMNDDTAAFICESLPGCGGQIVFPDGYLRDAYHFVRQRGGVCIADEVQVGFGRVGSHFWAFETQGVIPDIVTLGKPIGNGHPIGAVVTTHEIADSFANGMEFFSTFGGNPVSCAIGLAVLDVIADEHLQQNAFETGSYLLQGLTSLQKDHPLIGHVRGLGLFLGVELVSNRNTLAPAAKEAEYVVNRMKERGILLSTDGPLHNVIKIKPPLVFTKKSADFLIENLHTVLQEDALRLE